jgi:hypothetical protein
VASAGDIKYDLQTNRSLQDPQPKPARISNAVQQNQAPVGSKFRQDARMAGVRAPQRNRAAIPSLLLLLAIAPTGARGETIETEHLFGFTIGTDVGIGERELEGSVTGRFGKRDGSYLASASTMSVEFVPVAMARFWIIWRSPSDPFPRS